MRVPTRLLIWLSGFGFAFVLGWRGQELAAGIAVGGHVLFYQLHVLEVKVNRLLDAHGLVITDEDLDRSD